MKQFALEEGILSEYFEGVKRNVGGPFSVSAAPQCSKISGEKLERRDLVQIGENRFLIRFCSFPKVVHLLSTDGIEQVAQLYSDQERIYENKDERIVVYYGVGNYLDVILVGEGSNITYKRVSYQYSKRQDFLLYFLRPKLVLFAKDTAFKEKGLHLKGGSIPQAQATLFGKLLYCLSSIHRIGSPKPDHCFTLIRRFDRIDLRSMRCIVHEPKSFFMFIKKTVIDRLKVFAHRGTPRFLCRWQLELKGTSSLEKIQTFSNNLLFFSIRRPRLLRAFAKGPEEKLLGEMLQRGCQVMNFTLSKPNMFQLLLMKGKHNVNFCSVEGNGDLMNITELSFKEYQSAFSWLKIHCVTVSKDGLTLLCIFQCGLSICAVRIERKEESQAFLAKMLHQSPKGLINVIFAAQSGSEFALQFTVSNVLFFATDFSKILELPSKSHNFCWSLREKTIDVFWLLVDGTMLWQSIDKANCSIISEQWFSSPTLRQRVFLISDIRLLSEWRRVSVVGSFVDDEGLVDKNYEHFALILSFEDKKIEETILKRATQIELAQVAFIRLGAKYSTVLLLKEAEVSKLMIFDKNNNQLTEVTLKIELNSNTHFVIGAETWLDISQRFYDLGEIVAAAVDSLP